MPERIRLYWRAARAFLAARTPEEREKRRAQGLALLLVAAVALARYVTGLTVGDAPFTLYVIAVAASAAWGGFEPGLVATLASLLAGGIGLSQNAGHPRLLFLFEGLAVTLVVSAVRARVGMKASQLRGAEAMIAELRARDRHGRMLDEARRREWEEYREAALRAQDGLQRAADETRRQLAAIESLTDPSLNPLGGADAVAELLERLRGAVRADGAALVQPRRGGSAVTATGGLQALGAAAGADGRRLTSGCVAVVQNDPGRVAQLSGLRWSSEVASLLVVPVMHDGLVWSTVEVVSERSRQVGDWDVALARIVADRLAAFVVQEQNVAARAS